MTITKRISMILALLIGLVGLATLGVACFTITQDGALPQLRPDNAVEINNRFYEVHRQQDDLGNVAHVKANKTIYVAKDSKRVIIFGNVDLDSFLSLGLQSNVVGRSVMSGTPEHIEEAYPLISLNDFNDGKPGVVGVSGGTASSAPHEPNYDIIIDLEPDLIIIEGRQRSGRGSTGHFQRLSAIAPTLDFGLITGEELEDNSTNLKDIAKMYQDKADIVQEKISAIDIAIQDTKVLASINNPKTLMVLKNGDRYSLHGEFGRWSIVYNAFGFSQALSGLSDQAHGTELTPSIIQDNSNDIELVLFIDQSGENGVESILDHEYFKDVPAVANSNVYQLNSTWYFASGGVRILLDQIKEVSDALTNYNLSLANN